MSAGLALWPSSAAPWDILPPCLPTPRLAAWPLSATPYSKSSPQLACLYKKTSFLYRNLLGLSMDPPKVFSFPLCFPVPGKQLCGRMDLNHQGREGRERVPEKGQSWAWGTRGMQGGREEAALNYVSSEPHLCFSCRYSPQGSPQTAKQRTLTITAFLSVKGATSITSRDEAFLFEDWAGVCVFLSTTGDLGAPSASTGINISTCGFKIFHVQLIFQWNGVEGEDRKGSSTHTPF